MKANARRTGSRAAAVLGLSAVLGCSFLLLARESLGSAFVRGDSNQDGVVDISDAIHTLGVKFLGVGEIRCEDAADANDDGAIDISDPVYALAFLFLGGPRPPAPFPAAGEDPTADGLSCGTEYVSDSDGDGIPDSWEAAMGLDPRNPADAARDADGDGLSNLEEFRRGTDPRKKDSDSDGLEDGREVSLGTNPASADTDGDGLSDGDEVAGRTDPLRADSDSDGLSDGAEASMGCDPLDPDADADGLSDGEEAELGTSPTRADTDGDGISDAEELRAGTDPAKADTDDDGLPDGAEKDDHGTDPLSPDTDSDGLSDGDEVRTHGTDPLNADSDSDGLEDGREVALGADPHSEDSDSDGAIDGWDPSVLATDADGDGIPDGREASNRSSAVEAETAQAHGAVVGDPEAKGGSAVRPSAGLLAEHRFEVRAGAYRVFARARRAGAAAGAFGIEVVQGGRTILADSYQLAQGYRWHSTGALELAAGEVTVRFGSSLAGATLDRIFLVWAPRVNAPVTDPGDPDTDGDGVGDGLEAEVEAHWFEAEHFALNAAQVRDAVEASNSKDLLPRAEALPGGIHPVLHISDPDAIYSAGPWTVFVRARSDTQNLANQLIVHASVGGRNPVMMVVNLVPQVGTLPGGAPLYQNLYDWFPGPTFFVNPPGETIDVTVSARGVFGEIHVDEVLLAQLTFEGRPASYVAADPGSPPVQVSTWAQVPNDLSNPMDRDTDGDGFRPQDGVLPGSAGELTDAHERAIRTNPLDADTDGDGPDDASDLNPRSADTDGDGLLDSWEDKNVNGLYEPHFGETDWLDADTDDDGIPDGAEDRNLNGFADAGETDPRNPDMDLDGIQDGTEMGRTAGAPDLGPARGTGPAFIPDADPSTRTSPLNVDTDGDGLRDSVEEGIDGKADPTRGETRADRADTDGDGLSDPEEFRRRTDPNDRDTDDDGLEDGEEVNSHHTDPLDPDTDRDGLYDGEEVEEFGTDPNRADTDGDGISDGDEAKAKTDPKRADTDGDGEPDGTDPFPSNWPPEVAAGPDKSGVTGEEIAFYGYAGDPDGYIFFQDYVWTFGDGARATGPIVTHAYASAGSFTVRLTVTDRAGESAFDEARVTIVRPNSPPVAEAGSAKAAKAGERVSFDGSGSRDPDGSIASYLWNFADRGATATGKTASHVFQDAGTYYVTLTVKDDRGAEDTDTVVVSIEEPRPPDLAVSPSDMAWSPSSPKDGETVQVTVTIRNLGEVRAEGFSVDFFDDHERRYASATPFASRAVSAIEGGGSKSVSASLRSVLRGTHWLRVRIQPGSNSDSDLRNDEAARELEVRASSESAFYLGYAKTLTESETGSGRHQKDWLEPAWHYEVQPSLNQIRVETTAGFATAGTTWASIWTKPFEIRESTRLKSGSGVHLQAQLRGELKAALSAFVGILGYAKATFEVEAYLERKHPATGEWIVVSSQKAADERETNGTAEYGIGIGGVIEDPYADGIDAVLETSAAKAGEVYRVRLCAKTYAAAGGNCGAASDAYYKSLIGDTYRKVRWSSIELESW